MNGLPWKWPIKIDPEVQQSREQTTQFFLAVERDRRRLQQERARLTNAQLGNRLVVGMIITNAICLVLILYFFT